MPGEKAHNLERPEFAWRPLAEQGVGPDDAEIIRQPVYTFEARQADRFRSGRVSLVGDAAHTMPPFMGQAMCPGMRDAANLAWKLDLVLRGAARDALLDTYETERSPHAFDWMMISLEAGKVPCTLDPELARQRDERFKTAWLPPMPDFPKLVSGVLHRVNGIAAAPVGELGSQARTRKDGQVGLLDGFVSPFAFTLISTVGEPEHALDPRRRAALSSVGVTYLKIGDEGDVEDIDGAYDACLRTYGAEAIIVRLDFYVFSIAARIDAPDRRGASERVAFQPLCRRFAAVIPMVNEAVLGSLAGGISSRRTRPGSEDRQPLFRMGNRSSAHGGVGDAFAVGPVLLVPVHRLGQDGCACHG